MLGINRSSNTIHTSFQPKEAISGKTVTAAQPQVKYLVSEGTQTEDHMFYANGFNHVDFSTDAHGTIFDCSIDEDEGTTTGLADNYDNVSHKVGILSRFSRSVAGALSDKIASWIHSTRSFFYQTEYELLVALKDPSQTIRTTKSWFFGGERESLWGARYSNPVHVILLNIPKRLFFQGFLRSTLANIFNYSKTELLELAKVIPSVIKDRAQLLADYYSKQVVYLTTEATVVLGKGKEYQNCNYLKDLRARLNGVLVAHVADVAEMKTSKVSEGNTQFVLIQKAFEAKFKAIYPNGHSHLEQVDAHKDFVTAAFLIADDMAQKAKVALEKVREILSHETQLLAMDKAERSEHLKGQIHEMTQILLDLRAAEQKVMKAFAGLEAEMKEYNS